MDTPDIATTGEFKNNPFGDKFLQFINGDMFDDVAYSTYFKIKLQPELADRFTFYIIAGTDSGMLLQQLYTMKRDFSSVYLFIEERSVLNALDKKTLNSKHKNILISTFEDWQEKAESLDLIKYIEVNRVQLIPSFGIKNLIFQPYAEQILTLQEQIERLKWLHPDKFQKKIYIQRQLENCLYNINPAIKLKNIFEGKPALILAGGPSLDKYINWIEKNQENYVVIAASRIANRLISTTIIPDIFVTADPFESAYDTSKEVLAFSEKSILVSQNYAHPAIISQWYGRHFYFGNLLPWQCDYNPQNINGIGPTVANCAIHLGLHMGIFEQILFGVDLCYTSNGQSHASASIEQSKGSKLGFVGVPVTTNNNKTAETTYEMSQAVVTISLLAELAQKRGGKIITPNPEAVKIDWVEYQNLNTIQHPYKTVDSGSVLVNNENNNNLSKSDSHCIKISEELNNVLESCYFILSQTNAILDLYLTIYPALFDIFAIPLETPEHFTTEDIDKLFRLEESLDQHEQIINIIENFGTNDFFNFFRPQKERVRSDRIKERDSASYYKSLNNACYTFIEFINNILDKIDLQKKQNSKINDADNNRQNTGKLKSDTDSQSESTIKKKVILDNTENKLYNFFQKNNRAGLERLIAELEQYNSSDTKALNHLARGYLLELEDKAEQAIAEYLYADTEQTLESSLKRLVAIALKTGELESAVVGYQALASISSSYLIPLAQLYQTAEQYKDALDTYSQYIENNPDDILILIEMAQLYRSLEIFDGAKFILNHILDFSPDDQTAAMLLEEITKSEHKTF